MHILDHFQKDIETKMNLMVIVLFFDIGATIGDSENGRVTAPDVNKLNGFRLLRPWSYAEMAHIYTLNLTWTPLFSGEMP